MFRVDHLGLDNFSGDLCLEKTKSFSLSSLYLEFFMQAWGLVDFPAGPGVCSMSVNL